MDLTKLFDKQRELDKRIVREKRLEGQDLLPKKILALQVELGELANEWRGFKFWSEDQEPRTVKRSPTSRTSGYFKNPLLEEYVDCLHFILSIGLERGFDKGIDGLLDSINQDPVYKGTLIDHFTYVFGCVTPGMVRYKSLFNSFVGLGEWLGFSWEQIETAYMEKNAVNHTRQSEGY